jgi:hypothetical protein
MKPDADVFSAISTVLPKICGSLPSAEPSSIAAPPLSEPVLPPTGSLMDVLSSSKVRCAIRPVSDPASVFWKLTAISSAVRDVFQTR